MTRLNSLCSACLWLSVVLPASIVGCGANDNHGPTVGAPTVPVVINEGGASTGVGGASTGVGGATAIGGSTNNSAGNLGVGGSQTTGTGGDSFGVGGSTGTDPFGTGGTGTGTDPFGTGGTASSASGSPGSFSGTTSF